LVPYCYPLLHGFPSNDINATLRPAMTAVLYVMSCMLQTLVTIAGKLWLVHARYLICKIFMANTTYCGKLLAYIISARDQQAQCFEISCFTLADVSIKAV